LASGGVTNEGKIKRNGGVTNGTIRTGINGEVTDDSKILIKFQNNYTC
jgi:hypothetical protein